MALEPGKKQQERSLEGYDTISESHRILAISHTPASDKRFEIKEMSFYA